jgi:hypothetical protein
MRPMTNEISKTEKPWQDGKKKEIEVLLLGDMKKSKQGS